jgi:hypothetical protein
MFHRLFRAISTSSRRGVLSASPGLHNVEPAAENVVENVAKNGNYSSWLSVVALSATGFAVGWKIGSVERELTNTCDALHSDHNISKWPWQYTMHFSDKAFKG